MSDSIAVRRPQALDPKRGASAGWLLQTEAIDDRLTDVHMVGLPVIIARL